MTGVYTEKTLKFLTKPHITNLSLKKQEHTNSIIPKLTGGIRNLNLNLNLSKFCKKVNDALLKQAASLEFQCWRNAQDSRRECVQIIDMYNSIVHSDLSEMVCNAFQHIGADICEGKIDTYPPTQQKKLFINDSLCPYYRGLWIECKKLWANKKKFKMVDGCIKNMIKVALNDYF